VQSDFITAMDQIKLNLVAIDQVRAKKGMKLQE